MSMKHRILSSRILFTLVFVVPLLKTGCDGGLSGNRRCFAWTKPEGACPAQAEAIDFFEGSCPIPVSVDSPGEFLGDRCCYDVTGSYEEPWGVQCPPFGVGGSFPATSAAFSVGVGPSTGPPDGPPSGCVRCDMHLTLVLQGVPVPPCRVSQESQALWNTLFDCLCTGACQSACSTSFCSVGIPTTACLDCAADTSVGCGDELSACTNDL